MNIKKIIFFFSALFFLTILTGCSKDVPVDENAQIIFFYGRECPHCLKVEEFFAKEKITEKVNFVQAEVYHNKENVEVMKKKAEICKIDEKDLGVPMLWTGGECLMGDESIIKFFEEKVKAENK